MGLEYVDIFYHHRMDPNTPLEETMGALEQAVRSGKALYVGLSNYDGPTLERATAILTDMRVPFVINQNRYNILDRTVEKNGLKETAPRLGKGIICFTPLAQGVLTDRYLNGIPADSRMAQEHFLKSERRTPELLEYLHQLEAKAQASNRSIAQEALKWVLDQKGVTSVLVGASSVEQLKNNLQTIF
jgi:L-glyceraldehyde 3-phosphate reductase